MSPECQCFGCRCLWVCFVPTCSLRVCFAPTQRMLFCLCDIQQDAKHLLRLEHCFCVELRDVLRVSNLARPHRIFSARKSLVYQELCTDLNQWDVHYFYSLCDQPYQASHRRANTDNWCITHLGLPDDPHFIKLKNTRTWRLTSGLLSKSSRSICGGYSFRLSYSRYWSTKCGWGWSPSCSASLSSLAYFGCCMTHGGCTCPPP